MSLHDATTDTGIDTLSGSDRARLCRWRAHLAARGVEIPETDDFTSFGRLSTLERLRKVLRVVAPETCGPLARAISRLKAEKTARAGSKAKGGRRGPAVELSIPVDALRDDWRATFADMHARRSRIDAGLMIFDRPEPPAASMIGDIQYVLRALSKVCHDHGCVPAVKSSTVRLWLARQEHRGSRPAGLSLQLRLLQRFLAFRGEKPKLRKKLGKLAADYTRRGTRQRKRKHDWLLQNPTDIVRVWDLAEDVLALSRAAPAGSCRRARLACEAAVLALSVNMPLRCGDLHRLQVGQEITRDADGWRAELVTGKTGDDYEMPALWPETTRFLDEILILEAPGGDMWRGYDGRVGTPLFSCNGGTTALSAEWVSEVFYDHVGTGQHIMRSLWHQLAYDNEEDLTWMALALCGQRGKRTAGQYHQRHARVKSVRAGRQVLAASRAQALREARIPLDGR